MKKILVLGGNGFIGSHVVDQLLNTGYSISVFDRGYEKYRTPHNGVKYFLGEFSNTPLLAEALEGVDTVIHLISTTVPSTSNLNPIADIQTNLVGTVNLLELMVSAKVRRIVFLSSGGTVYGLPKSIPISEYHPLNPICSYGVVKIAIEKYIKMFEYLYGIQAVILRPSNPYGPHQSHEGVQGVISTFLRKIISCEPITIWGDGSVIRDYLYISDLAELCSLVINSDVNGVFNVGSGKGHSLNEIIKAIEKITNLKAIVEYQEARNFDVSEVVLDVNLAKDTFNWTPDTLLEAGIKKHLHWFSQLDLS